MTLSIGTGRGGETLDENNKMANLALEMALGRGGDQVVVKSPSPISFTEPKAGRLKKALRLKRGLWHMLCVKPSTSVHAL